MIGCVRPFGGCLFANNQGAAEHERQNRFGDGDPVQ